MSQVSPNSNPNRYSNNHRKMQGQKVKIQLVNQRGMGAPSQK